MAFDSRGCSPRDTPVLHVARKTAYLQGRLNPVWPYGFAWLSEVGLVMRVRRAMGAGFAQVAHTPVHTRKAQPGVGTFTIVTLYEVGPGFGLT